MRGVRVAAQVTLAGPPEGSQLYTGRANRVTFTGTVTPADTGARAASQTPSPALIRLVGVEKTLGRQRVLRGVNLEIREGENMVIIGRSGGGKSVLLKHILGLMRPDAGQIWFRDKNLAQLSEEQMVPLRKETGMLFQNGALFDSLTVGENVAFPLREKGDVNEKQIRSEVARALKIVDLPNQEEQMALRTKRRHAETRGPGPSGHRQARLDALR